MLQLFFFPLVIFPCFLLLPFLFLFFFFFFCFFCHRHQCFQKVICRYIYYLFWLFWQVNYLESTIAFPATDPIFEFLFALNNVIKSFFILTKRYISLLAESHHRDQVWCFRNLQIFLWLLFLGSRKFLYNISRISRENKLPF